MCCLFGLLDTQNRMSGENKTKLLHLLALAAEARGTDASGVAYHDAGRLVIRRQRSGNCWIWGICNLQMEQNIGTGIKEAPKLYRIVQNHIKRKIVFDVDRSVNALAI